MKHETGLFYLPTQLERTLQLYWCGKCSERGWREASVNLLYECDWMIVCMLAWANFTFIMECTPESDCWYSVYSVV
jgi:hypothetical protein